MTKQYEIALFAGGCFWGVEHLMKDFVGVVDIVPGYTGGHVKNPTYEQVCTHTTGHAETVKITFAPEQVSYETLVKRFMEIHDPTQVDGQGPDLGPQYRSEIFYTTPIQQKTALHVIDLLKQKGLAVVTKVTPAGPFYTAEEYHHKYYVRKGTQPYCHRRVKRFE